MSKQPYLELEVIRALEEVASVMEATKPAATIEETLANLAAAIRVRISELTTLPES